MPAPDLPRHTSGTAAALVSIERWRLMYLVERGTLPGPSLVVAGRRLFSDHDLARIRGILDGRPGLRVGRRVVSPPIERQVQPVDRHAEPTTESNPCPRPAG